MQAEKLDKFFIKSNIIMSIKKRDLDIVDFSNMSGTVIAPIALQYMNAGIDYNAFLVMIAFVVQCAFITPSAYATVTIFLGGETFEGDSKFLWKNGW